MKIRFVCNAGVVLEHNNEALLIDLPNAETLPFHRLPDDIWRSVCKSDALPSRLVGFFFTHDHPDHLDHFRLGEYIGVHPDVPVFVPASVTKSGLFRAGSFEVEYHRFDHAPIPEAPPHVVAIVSVGGKRIYITGDAALDCDMHRQVLNGRTVDMAIWNSMYLSRANTRELLGQVSPRSYIYHMPLKPLGAEMWKKCDKNLERYEAELKNVTVIDQYPTEVSI